MSRVNDASRLYDTVLFEYLQLYVAKAVAEQELLTGRLDVFPLMARCDAREMVAKLHYLIAGLKETVEFRWPANWWEAVKQRFAPAWFVKRWPVQETLAVVDAWRLWQNGPTFPEGWKPEYRVVIARPMSDAWSGL